MFDSVLPVFGNSHNSGANGCGDCSSQRINATRAATGRELPGSDALLPSPEHVLSTLERDGSRRWMRPKLSKGPWWQRRRLVAYVLMVVFVVVPHVKIWGKPLIRLDIAAREFTLFGHTFLPTDTLLLALAMLTAFISIVFITAVTGRAWCGWACPQTVYIEFLFRPIDRLFEGTTGKGGQPKESMSIPKKIGRFVVYLLLVMFLAYVLGLFCWARKTGRVDSQHTLSTSDSVSGDGGDDWFVNVRFHDFSRANVLDCLSLRTLPIGDA